MIIRGLIFALFVLHGSALLSSTGDKAAPYPARGNAGFPGFSAIAAGPWQLRQLPGRQEFTFTMYGCPGSLDELQQLVGVMREKGLGNGFDPGPTARASSSHVFEYLATVGWPIICYPGWSDMQIKHGRCRLGDEDEEAMKILDRAGVFSAIQLGEWGYYFHNLSPAESWWRDVYGKDFEVYKHLMQPPGLKGYDRRPTSRQECYEAVKDYFLTRNRYMRGRIPEARYLRPTPFGESFDVLLSSATGEVLQSYPVVLLVGDMTFDARFIDGLRQALRSGSKLLQKRHAEALGDRLTRLKEAGPVEVLPSWTNPATGRPAAISNARLAGLIAEHLPVVIEGDPIQYQVNRIRQGWVIELVHNGGIIKKPDGAAEIDLQAVAHVQLQPRVSIRKAQVWGSNQELPLGQPLAMTIPPGRSVFVELVLQDQISH